MLKLPLRTGPDIDWRSKCHPGDNQGETDSCAVFAIANWVECMLGTAIDDEAAINLWREERQFRYRDLAGGLTVPEAFAAAMIRGRWLPGGTSLRRVTSLDTLPLAPLVVGFHDVEWQLQPGSTRISLARKGTYHAVLAVTDLAGSIWIENSHGPAWGENGFANMSHAAFAATAAQIWQIILPATPATLSEASRQQMLSLAESIGTEVTSIARNLQTLGYSLPGNGRLIMSDIMRRSMIGELNAAQEKAKGNLADVYMMLVGGGVTDAAINAVWAVIKPTTNTGV